MHNNHSIIRWLPLISRHTPAIAVMAAIHRDTEKTATSSVTKASCLCVCLQWQRDDLRLFPALQMCRRAKMKCLMKNNTRSLHLRCRTVAWVKNEAREPGRGLLPRKRLSPISSPNSPYIILESWVQAERRECMCAHQNKASGASCWYVILRKPGGTFDLCAFREINPRVLSLLWEEQTCCNAVKHGTRMKSKLCGFYFLFLSFDANVYMLTSKQG